MQIRYLVIFLFAMIVSCNSNEDEGIDCALFDPAFETIYITVKDVDGNNLIENGTYNKEDIVILYNEQSIGFITNYAEETDALVMETVGNGKTDFTIVLNDSTIDTLQLNVTAKEGPCSIIFYTTTQARYNNEIVEIEILNDYSKLITILK